MESKRLIINTLITQAATTQADKPLHSRTGEGEGELTKTDGKGNTRHTHIHTQMQKTNRGAVCVSAYSDQLLSWGLKSYLLRE